MEQIVATCNRTIGSLKNFGSDRQMRVMEQQDEAQHADIAERLGRLRETFSDWNRREWAERHKFNYGQYRMWESGARRIPIEASTLLCEKYGVSLDWIYLGRWTGVTEESARKLRA